MLNEKKTRDSWGTPSHIIEELTKEFGQLIDVTSIEGKCAPGTIMCDYDFMEKSPNTRAFENRAVFMNPPYSRGNIYKAVEAGIKLSWEAEVVILLIKVGTSTKYWDLIWDYKRHEPKPGVEIRYFPKRVKFIAPEGIKESSPSIETCLVILRKVS